MIGPLHTLLSELPGFDVVGLIVRVQLPDDDAWHQGVRFTREDYGTRRLPVWVIETDRDLQTLLVAENAIRAVAIDFSDAATRDRATRWLSRQEGYPVHRTWTSTAPFWGRSNITPERACWLLGDRLLGYSHGPEYEEPYLGALDPADKTRLDDESLLVDALALQAVCETVGRLALARGSRGDS